MPYKDKSIFHESSSLPRSSRPTEILVGMKNADYRKFILANFRLGLTYKISFTESDEFGNDEVKYFHRWHFDGSSNFVRYSKNFHP